jgi:hypothetical protein
MCSKLGNGSLIGAIANCSSYQQPRRGRGKLADTRKFFPKEKTGDDMYIAVFNFLLMFYDANVYGFYLITLIIFLN